MNSALLLKTRISIAACPKNSGPTYSCSSLSVATIGVCPIMPPGSRGPGLAWPAGNHNQRQNLGQLKLPKAILRVVFTRFALYRFEHGIERQLLWIQLAFHDPLKICPTISQSLVSLEYPPLVFHLNYVQLNQRLNPNLHLLGFDSSSRLWISSRRVQSQTAI